MSLPDVRLGINLSKRIMRMFLLLKVFVSCNDVIACAILVWSFEFTRENLRLFLNQPVFTDKGYFLSVDGFCSDAHFGPLAKNCEKKIVECKLVVGRRGCSGG